MATFIAASAFNVNDPDFLNYFNNITDGTIGSNKTASYFRASATVDGVSSFVDIYGSGFSYFPDGTPFFGQINRVVGNVAGQQLFELKDVAIDIFPTLANWTSYTPQQIMEEVFAGNDTITGSAEADVISGFAGADKMYGYGGNDAYYVDNAGDQVFEKVGNGNDTVKARVSYTLAAGQEIETLMAASGAGKKALDLTGNELANTLRGNAGANVLDGGVGADKMYGYGGSDTYLVERLGDKVFESVGGGTDTVKASVSYMLTAGQEIEILMAASDTTPGRLYLTGNEFANILKGNTQGNVLNGAGGADKMYGYGGDDVYLVDNAGDNVFESAGNGTDFVKTTVSYKLTAGQEIEYLAVASETSTAALDLTGNAFANILKGNYGSNILNGSGGADRMYGFRGNDTYIVDDTGDLVYEDAHGGTDTVRTSVSFKLGAWQEVEYLVASSQSATTPISLTGSGYDNTLKGNDGDNILNGGLGNDRLRGYGGADSFIFDKALSSGNVDSIVDFASGTDKIRLDDAIFKSLQTGELSAQDFSDHFTYSTATGILSYDADGPGGAAAIQFAIFDNKISLKASDFVVF